MRLDYDNQQRYRHACLLSRGELGEATRTSGRKLAGPCEMPGAAMTATREQALQHAIEVFFGRRSLGNVSYGDIRNRLDGQHEKARIDRLTASALLEESPSSIAKLLKVVPPKSPFKPGKPETSTVKQVLEWHDALIKLGKAQPRTGIKWAQPNTSILRNKAKLPVVYYHRDGNTIIEGILLSASEIYTILEKRRAVGWMTLEGAMEHPHWHIQNDRVRWAVAYGDYQKEQLDRLVSDAQHAALSDVGRDAAGSTVRRTI